MEDLPIHVDYLLSGATIITMNPVREILENASIAIKGSKIAWIGDTKDVTRQFDAKHSLDCTGKLIMPGLINVHGHWAMTLFRGMVDDITLEGWLAKVWKAEAAYMTEENVIAGAQLAMMEMIRSGTTCAADMYWHYRASTEAARRAGFRMINGPSFAEIEGFKKYRHTNQEIATAYLDEYKDIPLVHPCVQAHSAYTTNPELLKIVSQIAAERNLLFITHASESVGELDMVRQKYGKRPLEVLHEHGLLGKHTLLAHCVHLTDQEIQLLAETGTSVAHCPASNLKLSSGIARVSDMLKAGVNVAIGTDGAASNNDLDLFHEAQLAALMQKGVSGDPTVLPAEKVVFMLTIDAAKAVGLQDLIGSLEVGKLADLVVIDMDSPNLTPHYNLYSHLVYAISPHDVCHTMVNGQMLMQDRQLLNLDEPAVKAKVCQIAKQIQAM